MKLAALATLLLALATPAFAAVGAQATEIVFFNFPDQTPNPACTSALALDVIYTQYGGWLATESNGLESLSAGSVWGPLTLPRNLSAYGMQTNSGGAVIGTGTELLKDDSKALISGLFDYHTKQLVVFVYTTGTGAGTGVPIVMVGCGSISNYMNLHTMAHEGGHAQAEGLQHAAGITCPSVDVPRDFGTLMAPPPASPYYTQPGPGCSWLADHYEIMSGLGGTTGVSHYAAHFYGRLGWLQASNVQVLTGDSTAVAITRIDVSTTDVQEVQIPIDTLHYYTVDYRPSFGALIRVRCIVTSNTAAGPQCLWLDSNEALLLNSKNGFNDGAITAANPFFDPYRGIRITFISADGTTAHLQVDYNVCS